MARCKLLLLLLLLSCATMFERISKFCGCSMLIRDVTPELERRCTDG